MGKSGLSAPRAVATIHIELDGSLHFPEDILELAGLAAGDAVEFYIDDDELSIGLVKVRGEEGWSDRALPGREGGSDDHGAS